MKTQDDSYIIFIELNKKNMIHGIRIEYVELEDVKNRNQKKLDELGIKVYPEDEKCPCGSNKMYGECCKLKGL